MAEAGPVTEKRPYHRKVNDLVQAYARIRELEAETKALKRVLKQARAFFEAGWRHERPLAYLRFRRRMNELLGIPPDFEEPERPEDAPSE